MYKKQWFPSADLRVWPIFFIKWDLELSLVGKGNHNLKAKRVLYGIALGSVGDLCPHRSHASIQGLHQVKHLILTTIK